MATFDDAINIAAPGFTASTGAGSARTAIPLTAAGTAPRYVRVSAINESYIRIGDSTITATPNDTLVQPADAVLLRAQGCTHIAYIQGGAVGKVNVVPLEDQ